LLTTPKIDVETPLPGYPGGGISVNIRCMQTRRYGRTEHHSTIAVFGACAFADVTQAHADAAMEQVIAAGVNHIDVAPSYGTAEARLGPWLAQERERFFLNCKTLERTREGAASELRRSLAILQVEHFDVYQFHAVNSFDDLEAVLQTRGALEAVIEAREAGLVRFIGLTGHGIEAPKVFLEALRRFDFDTLMFPLNHAQCADGDYGSDVGVLLRQCDTADVGTLVIKAFTQAPWHEHERTHSTWYRPITAPADTERAIDFALAHDITGMCTPSDMRLLPAIFEACERYSGGRREPAELAIAGAEALFT